MMSSDVDPATPEAARARHSLLLLGLFVGSGCSALVYEIIWFHILQQVIGASAVSLGVLLGTFMGGMCLGSLGLPRAVSAAWHPLRIYALLEVGIAAAAVLLLNGMPKVGEVYLAWVGYGLPGTSWRGAICAVCLLPPTILMGGTLPAISRWIGTSRQGIAELGIFYGANTFGAVIGCLSAGFYLLRVYDVVAATYAAVAVNVTVAVVAWFLARCHPHAPPAEHAGWMGEVAGHPGEQAPASLALARDSRGALPFVVIAISGLTAMGAEVIWTRLLSLLLGATVYALSIILAVFLAGLGLGSGIGSYVSRRTARPLLALGWCQFLLTLAIAWAAYAISCSLPFWPIDPTLSRDAWLEFQLDLVRCLWAIFPATCMWGASFPLALAAAARGERDSAYFVGRIYAANTLGAILGATGFSLLFIALLGTRGAQQLLIGTSATAALLTLATVAWRDWRIRAARGDRVGHAAAVGSALGLVALAGLEICLVASVADVPRGLIAFGRHLPSCADPPEYVYVGEGMNSSIAVSKYPDGTRSFHVSGKVEASGREEDMRLQRMLGHLPCLFHPRPRSVLVVGCGAGVTAGSLILDPDVVRVVICEIEPLIPAAAAKYFGNENNFVLDDRRVQVIYDDARHFIATTTERFDIITSDPIHPWVKGSAALYSQEYFELCRKRLNPGGLVTQWVPLYETNLQTVKSELATFFRVFPSGTIWSNDIDGEGYDLVLVGSAEAMTIDGDEVQGKLDRADEKLLRQSLDEVGLGSVLQLFMAYAGRGSDLQAWLKGAEINRDRNLRLQYLAGMGLNTRQADAIYQDLLKHWRYPEDLFVPRNRRGG